MEEKIKLIIFPVLILSGIFECLVVDKQKKITFNTESVKFHTKFYSFCSNSYSNGIEVHRILLTLLCGILFICKDFYNNVYKIKIY